MGGAAMVPSLLTPEEFLAEESIAMHRHEFIGGVVYAMAGGPAQHSLISTNLLAALHTKFRATTCRVFNSDMMVRIRLPTHTRFYYPDAQVVCRLAPADQHFQDYPVVVVEVLSPSTRRADELEKREGYLSMASVELYLLVEQDSAIVTAWRRHSSGFRCERWDGRDAIIPLPEVDLTLSLEEIYEGVTFPDPSKSLEE